MGELVESLGGPAGPIAVGVGWMLGTAPFCVALIVSSWNVLRAFRLATQERRAEEQEFRMGMMGYILTTDENGRPALRQAG